MILFTVFIVLTILTTIIMYFLQTDKDKKFEIGSLSILLQTLFVFVTLWITIYTIKSSNSDTEELFTNLNSFNSQLLEMNTSFDELSLKLKEMPKQLNEFSDTIDSLNNITIRQNEDFKNNSRKLNYSISELTQSVAGYDKNINNYSQQLSTVVDLTDKQLVIWKEQQRVLLEEFSRKPILRLNPKEFSFNDDSCKINDLILKNDGNIEANTRVIFLFFPSESQVLLKSPMFTFYKRQDGFDAYRLFPLDTNLEIIAAGSDIIIPCKINIPSKYRGLIDYRIDFYSKYNSGKELKTMQLQ